jgi:hypothetical protein
VRALIERLARRLRPRPLPPLRGPQAELARSLTFSAHAIARFRERGPGGAPGEAPDLALRRLVAERGKVAERPPRWFAGKRSGSAFFVVIDVRYVLPVTTARPGQLARRGMRPYVVTTFMARDARGAR